MQYSFLDRAAIEVLAHFHILAPHDNPVPLGNRGGFSGARLWFVSTSRGGPVCLRAWPEKTDRERIIFCHRLMSHARDAGLDFVPKLYAAATGQTAYEYAGRLWEVQQWRPGQADFHVHPSRARLKIACTALARLHAAWLQTNWVERGPCPGVFRRTEVLDAWHVALVNNWRPLDIVRPDDPVRPIVERALRVLPYRLETAAVQLRAALGPHDLQPCLRDPWHDHYLFQDDFLTGLIDYAAVQIDHPAVDLARTLGSLVEDDEAAWQAGIAAYRTVRAFSRLDEAFAHMLDRTGVSLSAAKWLLRLYRNGETVEDRFVVALRLERLVARMEKWGKS